MITSPHNPKIKQVKALLSKARQREKDQLLVLEGRRLMMDALHSGYLPQLILHSSETDIHWLEDSIPPHLIEAVDVTLFNELAETQHSQGVLGIFPFPTFETPSRLERVLLLDGIHDPGNLGTIIRTASGAGVDALILTPDCVDVYNPKVLRAGMGAHFRLPILRWTWEQIHHTPYPRVYLADSVGEQPYIQADWHTPWMLVIGSEAHGASENAHSLATQTIYIPMANATESLNAAIATAVILFHAVQQSD